MNSTSSKFKFQVPDGTGSLINYEVFDGLVPQTTLFIHGNLASNRWWHPAVSCFGARYTNQKNTGKVILAEFRGCGESSAPQNENEISIDIPIWVVDEVLHSPLIREIGHDLYEIYPNVKDTLSHYLRNSTLIKMIGN